MPGERSRRRPGGTAPRSASKEWSANAHIVGHEQLGFEVGPVAHAGVLDGDFEAAARKALTAPGMAIAVAAPPTPPKPPVQPVMPKPPKPRESPPSTTKTNGTVLHDSADDGTVIEANTATDDSGAPGRDAPCAVPRERDFLQVPSNGHQIHGRIGHTSHDWVKCDCWQSRQAYRAHTAQGQLADCADCAGSPNGADPRALRAHRLAASTELALTKLHCGPPGPVRRPRARVRGAFEQLQAVLAQEACDDL
jgi:hypothetical protein